MVMQAMEKLKEHATPEFILTQWPRAHCSRAGALNEEQTKARDENMRKNERLPCKNASHINFTANLDTLSFRQQEDPNMNNWTAPEHHAVYTLHSYCLSLHM